MKRSAHWPRPGYVKPYVHEETLSEIRSRPWAAELVELLSKTRKSEETICQLIADLLRKRPEDVELLRSIAVSDTVIKRRWANNGLEAAQRGTWMHLEFEVLLAGNLISNVSLEVSLFRTFLKRLIGVTIFRTEWMIFATRENIAGSIDFVGRTDEGSLVL